MQEPSVAEAGDVDADQAEAVGVSQAVSGRGNDRCLDLYRYRLVRRRVTALVEGLECDQPVRFGKVSCARAGSDVVRDGDEVLQRAVLADHLDRIASRQTARLHV